MSEVKDLITTPVNTVSTTPARLVGYGIGRDEMLFQADVTLGGGSISYTLEGRLDKNYQWRSVAGPYTDSIMVPISVVPELRVNVSAQSGAAAITRAGVVVR
jgi:hypothetical protein